MVITRWWVKKYRLPSNHNLFLESTLRDLLVEFFEDKFVDDPQALREVLTAGKFTDTGDQMIDDWFQTLEDGGIVNLWDAFSPESEAWVKKQLHGIESEKRAGPQLMDPINKASQSKEEIGELPLTFGE